MGSRKAPTKPLMTNRDFSTSCERQTRSVGLKGQSRGRSTMATDGSVTRWLQELRAGEAAVAQKLWEEYFGRLVGLARTKLAGKPRTLDDPEDIALSAFNSFYGAAQQGRFPKLNDRHDLWQILVMLTERKAVDAIRREQAVKRQGAVNIAPTSDGESRAGLGIENVAGKEPTPSFAAAVAEQCRCLLNQLPDVELRKIALSKLEGYSNVEIAVCLTRSLATVERKLALI